MAGDAWSTSCAVVGNDGAAHLKCLPSQRLSRRDSDSFIEESPCDCAPPPNYWAPRPEQSARPQSVLKAARAARGYGSLVTPSVTLPDPGAVSTEGCQNGPRAGHGLSQMDDFVATVMWNVA